ncbi:hypothetical protein SAMN04487893_10677 [Myroides guanonis]|uniref:Uncharacterized protein n=1 Tax=Myroides guanonis TaxID=1150112 RepID=A0A1I3QPK8_9FLAO|nr:hypothetical protein [Myroides guanonis]SFJ36103.1 hypothetical protein SAMN04487893_10677 [Myroides guanonis]
MLSSGQINFAICFIVAFVAVMIYVYRKDIKLHKTYYKGNYWVLIAFLSFIGLLFILKGFLKN